MAVDWQSVQKAIGTIAAFCTNHESEFTYYLMTCCFNNDKYLLAVSSLKAIAS